MTTEALDSLGATIGFIDCWIKLFDHNYLARSNMYIETILYLFKKIPVQLPKPLSHKGKRQLFLHAIGGDWYMKIMNEKIPPLRKLKLIKNYNIERTK